jgi:hydrogenase maturation factor
LADDFDPLAILPPGKLPGSLLGAMIARYVRPDSSVIVGPGVGRDAAAIDLGDRVLIVKTDPITFASDDIGRYLVNVNANDIACMGGTPRWLLVTALLPERSTTPQLVEQSFESLSSAASDIGVALVGGHTEITLGLDRPILVGQMIGEASHTELIDPTAAQPGDAILLASGIAIEGTAILAREAAGQLTALDPEMLERAAGMLRDPGISVLPAVRALRSSGASIRALHDPTEGGLATALSELAASTGRGVAVNGDAIEVLPETQMICAALGLDPLGLIASGALLAVIARDDTATAVSALSARGIRVSVLGELVADPDIRRMTTGGTVEDIPVFAVDEIARFFAAVN